MTRQDETPKGWLTCDEGVCLYADDRRIGRLKSDVPRCIKHGAILSPGWRLAGLSRREARAALNRSGPAGKRGQVGWMGGEYDR